MTEEIATADAEAGKISVDKTNISVTDFAQKRIGDLTPGTEQPQEQEAEEVIEQETEEVIEESVDTEEAEASSEESQDIRRCSFTVRPGRYVRGRFARTG